jgi:hypothetical protein
MIAIVGVSMIRWAPVLAVLTSIGVLPAAAANADVPGGCSANGSTVTCAFLFIPPYTEPTFVVPDGVDSLHVQAVGAPGAPGAVPRAGESGVPGAGSDGADVLATLAVSPGEQLQIWVGGGGAAANTYANGGDWGGGDGGGSDAGDGGGGGGAASAVFACSGSPTPNTCPNGPLTPLLVAGGGGGGGGAADSNGGNGGGINSDGTGAPGSAGEAVAGGAPGGGGGGGTASSGGDAGVETAQCSGGEVSGPGSSLHGGNGGVFDTGAGGGGGGYYGGGGGGGGGIADANTCAGTNAGGGGGGGGSSFGPADTTISQDATGDPQVVITYTAPPPPPPTNRTLPTISNVHWEGDLLYIQEGFPYPGLTAYETNGQWTNDPTGYEYQWERCNPAGEDCTPIPDATDQSYTLTTADSGSTIRVQETAINAGGAGLPATSPPTALVPTEPPPGPGLGPGPPSGAQIATMLAGEIKPHGHAARIQSIIKNNGYVLRLKTPSAGRLIVSWYLGSNPRNRKITRRTLIAQGKATFMRASTRSITLTLSRAGKKQLATSRRLRLVGLVRFAPLLGRPIASQTSFSLAR